MIGDSSTPTRPSPVATAAPVSASVKWKAGSSYGWVVRNAASTAVRRPAGSTSSTRASVTRSTRWMATPQLCAMSVALLAHGEIVPSRGATTTPKLRNSEELRCLDALFSADIVGAAGPAYGSP